MAAIAEGTLRCLNTCKRYTFRVYPKPSKRACRWRSC